MTDSQKRQWVIRTGQRALLRRLLDGQVVVTADDIRDDVPLPDRINPKVFGEVPKHFRKVGIIEAVEYLPSRRPIAHKRPLTVWKLRDRVAAEEWMRLHPAIELGEPVEKQGDLFASDLEVATHD